MPTLEYQTITLTTLINGHAGLFFSSLPTDFHVQEVVIFGIKWVSRNSGITNFETLFSAKSQIGSKHFLKSTFLANFSFFESQKQLIAF